jgi:3-oxoacyl-[acyl-carrier protein] reductase
MNLGLRGRVALVSGGSSGIGRATAEGFGAEGAQVALTYLKNRPGAEDAADNIRNSGGDALVVQLDLGDQESIQRAIDFILDRWGRLDVVVNNAAERPAKELDYTGPIENAPFAEWQRLMRSNVEGAFFAIRAAIPTMKSRHWGRIVNVSSIAATDGLAGYSWYSAAKAALHGLSRTLALELGPEGILVNVVVAGFTITERARAEHHPRSLEFLGSQLPIRRLPTAKDIASAIVFLCSEMNSAITGEIVRVSGGRG